MNDAGGREPGGLELALRDALRGSVAGLVVHPDEQDVRRRMRVRARRRRASTVGMSIALLAATAIGLAAVQRKADPQPIAATSSSAAEREPAVATTVVPSCELPAALPFVPTVLPGTWTRSSYEAANEGVPEVWTPTDHYGIVEIWNGRRADLPEPDASEPITVLGRAATIGPISDGYSMVVQLGPMPCDRWALVAHPGIDQAELRTIAEGLRPADGSSPSPSSVGAPRDRVIAVDGSNIVEKRLDGEEVVAPLPLAAAADVPVLLAGGDHVLIVVDGRVYVYDSRAWAPPVDAGPSLGLGVGVAPRIGFWSVDHMRGSLADGPTGEVVTWRLHGWDGRPVGPSVEVDRRDAQAVGATADGVFLQIMASAHLLYVSASGPTDFGECEVVASYGGRVACHRPRDGAYVVIEAAGAVTPIGTVGSLGLQAGVGAAAFAPSGRHLAIGRASGGTSPTGPGTLLVDLANPSRNRDLAGLDGSGGVLWSADGTRLLVVADQRLDANDGVVRPASAQWVDVGSGEAVGGRIEVSPPVVVIAPR